MKTHFRIIKHTSFALGITFVVCSSAPGDVILPGYNLLHTPDATVAVDLMDLGLVYFESNPIAGLGNTDTIIYRSAGLGDGETGTIQAEVVALSLISVDSFDLGFGLGRFYFGLDPTSPSFGQIEINSHGDDGGTFSSSFSPSSLITFRADFGDEIVISHREDYVTSLDVNLWSHTAPWNYPTVEDYAAGNFYVTGTAGQTGTYELDSAIVVPEPGTLLLFAIGLVSMRARKS